MSWEWSVVDNRKLPDQDIYYWRPWRWRMHWDGRPPFWREKMLDVAGEQLTTKEWEELGFEAVQEVCWLSPGQLLFAENVLYVPEGSIRRGGPQWCEPCAWGVGI